MSNPCFYAPQPLFGGSVYRTNALGLERAAATAAVTKPRPAPRGGAAGCNACTSCDGATAAPRAYEAGCLAGCLAYPQDGMAGQPLFTVRLTRSVPAPVAHGAFAIGTALCMATGNIEGVLARCAADGCAPGAQPDAGPFATLPLVSTAPDGSISRLTCPRALLLEPRRVVIVGSGVLLPAPTGIEPSTPVTGPAVAVVCFTGAAWQAAGVGCNCSGTRVTVTVGNGDTDVTDEEYNDIQADPVCASVAVWCEDATAVAAARCRRRAPALSAFTPHGPGQGSFVSAPAVTWLVAGSGIVSGAPGTGRTAIVRRIDAATLRALDTGILDLAATGAPGAAPDATSAVSLAAVSASGMLVAGVHVFESASGDVAAGVASAALLWPLVLASLDTVVPWATTAYNVPATTRLVQTGSTQALTLLRVLALPAGQVYVACVAAMDPATSLPAHSAQVYKFQADTSPDVGYGVGGISTWVDVTAAGSPQSVRANDAVFAPGGTGTVLVTGNSFALEVAADAPSPVYTYLVPCFPYLDVHVPAAPSGSACPCLPQPFVAAFADCAGGSCSGGSGSCAGGCSGGGCVTDVGDCCSGAGSGCGTGSGRVMTVLTGACLCSGCAPLHFATSTAVYAANACLVVGDSCFHVGSPSQAASTLAVNLALTVPARLLNGSSVCVPTISSCCSGSCGTVVVDALCAQSTTLQVHGPLVVGMTTSADGCAAAPVPLPGTIRFNPATATFEGYNGTVWVLLGGVVPPG